MNKKERIKQLEQTLTELLGKKDCTQYKKACTGKYRGYYDFGLTFEDDSHCFISLGKKYYLERLIKLYKIQIQTRNGAANINNATPIWAWHCLCWAAR